MFEKSFETKNTKEKEAAISSEIIDQALQEALNLAASLPSRNLPADPDEAKKFSETPQGKEKLDFHDVEHTREVIERTKKIIEYLKIAGVDIEERDEQLAEIAAGFHDSVQNFTENRIIETEGKFAGLIKIMRKRDIGNNEAKSADNAVTFMRAVNALEPGTFTEEDEKKVRNAISKTVPGFDPELSTVIQPNLDKTNDSSLIERALALSDIGTAGMEGPEKFLPEGDALFREENLDMRDAIYALNNGGTITKEYKEYYRSRMLAWTKFQPVFAAGRKQLLEKEIGALPEAAQKVLAGELFTHFDESIEAASQKFSEREKMTFEEIAKDMGYVLN